MIGRRHGIRYLARDILHSKRDLPVGTVISPEDLCSLFFSGFLPSTLVHVEASEAPIDAAVKRQEAGRRGEQDVDPRAFLVIDDCLANYDVVQSEPVRAALTQGRHLNLFCLITMLEILELPDDLRGNVDYVFITSEPRSRSGEPIESFRRRLNELYAGVFGTFNIFCQVMDKCTQAASA